MKLHVTKHAIYRFKTRVRDCTTRNAIHQIEAAYATGKLTHVQPGGHRFVRAGSLQLVIDPENRVLTVYYHGDSR